MRDSQWTLINLPPKGHDDVGSFVYDLFEIARTEKERLQVNKCALRNYKSYKGSGIQNTRNSNSQTPANLIFANISRTVNNVCASDPVGEVVDLDGETDDAEKILSAKNIKWWSDTGQRVKTRYSTTLMEIYGITVEKPFFDFARRYDADIELVDMFAFFPAPGIWDNISEDCPYICFAYVDFIDSIESKFNVTGVAADEAYELLGQEREKYKADAGSFESTGRYETPMLPIESSRRGGSSDKKLERGLIIELWIRDNLESEVDVMTVEEGESGEPQVVHGTEKKKVYPDGIRKITVTRSDGKKTAGKKDGFIVLDDSANPNINPELPVELAKYTHPWGRLPVYIANSYKDPISIWGFAAAEQVGYLHNVINEILKKMIVWTKNALTPPLILPRVSGITRQMIESDNGKGGALVLKPYTINHGIQYLQTPNLPQTFFVVLDKIISLFDRVYAIEEADRGQAPNGVIAYKAIAALQDQNRVALQSKTVAVESLVENRSKWAIGLWQNWGTDTDFVNVNGQPTEFIGVRYAGRKFNFVVESGSTTPRTQLQKQELLMELANAGKISNPFLLEGLNIPGWKEEVARTSGPLVEQALSILKDAGAPPEALQQMMEILQQTAQMMQEENPDVRAQVSEGQENQKSKAKAVA